MNRSCEYCEFFYEINNSNNIIVSTRCRRYPPQTMGGGFKFPEVDSDMWCGEYQHKESMDDIRSI